MDSNQSQTIQEERKSLKLYGFRNIKAKTFYRMLEKPDPGLLIRGKLPSDIIKEDVERLISRWEKIQEEYYKATDPGGFENFLSEQAFELDGKREKIVMDGIMELLDFEEQFGVELPGWRESAEKIGIIGTPAQMIRIIKQKRMRLRLAESRKQAEKKKRAKNDFYEFIAQAGRATGYRIPGDILLIEWCGILKDLRTNGDNTKK